MENKVLAQEWGISRKLRLLRLLSGYSQQALGKRLGIDLSVMNRYERGKEIPRRASVIDKFAELYGVSSDFLSGMAPLKGLFGFSPFGTSHISKAQEAGQLRKTQEGLTELLPLFLKYAGPVEILTAPYYSGVAPAYKRGDVVVLHGEQFCMVLALQQELAAVLFPHAVVKPAVPAELFLSLVCQPALGYLKQTLIHMGLPAWAEQVQEGNPRQIQSQLDLQVSIDLRGEPGDRIKGLEQAMRLFCRKHELQVESFEAELHQEGMVGDTLEPPVGWTFQPLEAADEEMHDVEDDAEEVEFMKVVTKAMHEFGIEVKKLSEERQGKVMERLSKEMERLRPNAHRLIHGPDAAGPIKK